MTGMTHAAAMPSSVFNFVMPMNTGFVWEILQKNVEGGL
jgi:hypothetical protein